MDERRMWSSYWPIRSPRRPRCPSSYQSSEGSTSSATTPNPSFPGSDDSENREIAGKVSGGPSLWLPTSAFAWWRRRKHKEHSNIPGKEDPALSQVRRFSLRELQIATNNFSAKNFVGRGGHGVVYKGRLRDGSLVAVKILRNMLMPGEELQFQMEVELISMGGGHQNLLRVLGFCMTSSEQMLVYPFMANGSVASRLTGLLLDWPTRRRVALGTARGLSYLHEHCDPKIIHRDVKAENIYLDDEYEAVVGDFGLAKLMDYTATHVTTAVRGTSGHIAPEYLITGKCTEKTDVFSYGMMLMELITGQRIMDLARRANDDDVMLLYWLKDILKRKRQEELVDPRLEGNYIGSEVESLLQISQLCIQGSAKDRPSMSEVVGMFDGDGLAYRWEEWLKVEVTRQGPDMSLDCNDNGVATDSEDDLDKEELLDSVCLIKCEHSRFSSSKSCSRAGKPYCLIEIIRPILKMADCCLCCCNYHA